jgi:hypothetical protein
MKAKHTNKRGRKKGNRTGRNRYGQKGVSLINNPKRAYIPDPDATLEDVYGADVPEVFRNSKTA